MQVQVSICDVNDALIAITPFDTTALAKDI